MWVAGKWYCPRCVEQLAPRKPEDLAYRFECFTCEFYRRNQYGGLSLEGQPEQPMYFCLKFEANQRCIFDEPLKVVVKPAPKGQETLAGAIGVTQPPPVKEPPTPKLTALSLVGSVSSLPSRPRLESPAPDRKSPPRRKRR
jgi:hypothetical protein